MSTISSNVAAVGGRTITSRSAPPSDLAEAVTAQQQATDLMGDTIRSDQKVAKAANTEQARLQQEQHHRSKDRQEGPRYRVVFDRERERLVAQVLDPETKKVVMTIPPGYSELDDNGFKRAPTRKEVQV
jgi:hypothetical protein